MKLISDFSGNVLKPARILALGVIPFGLIGCSHNEPGIEVRTVEVPVPGPCVPRDRIPDEPAAVGDRLTGDPVLDLPTVAASALALRAWGREMEAALIACAE